MAITYVHELGTATKTGAASTLAVTLSASATAGNVVIGRVVGDSGVGVSSVADSRGNTWTVDVLHATPPRPAIISTGQDVAALQSGDTVTITYSGSCNQAVAILDEFSGLTITAGRVDKTATGTATTTNRDAGTTATTTQGDELVIAAYALGAGETSFTHGTGYSDFTTKFLNASGTALEGQFQVVSATAAYNPTATGGFSNPSNGLVATYTMAPVVSWIQPPNRSPSARFAARRGLGMMSVTEDLLLGFQPALIIGGAVSADSPPRPTIILAAATALQQDDRRASRVITPRAPSTLPPAFARPPLPVVATARLARSQRHGSVIAPRPTTTLPAAFARPPLPVILNTRLARAHQHGSIIAPRAPTLLPPAFARPPLPVILNTRLASVQRHGSVVAPRAPTLLPPAFARPPLPLVVDVRVARGQRVGRVTIPRPVALAAGIVVSVVTPARPSVILARAAAAIRRVSHVVAPRAPTTLPPAFAKPPQPLVVDVRQNRSQRAGRVVTPRPAALAIQVAAGTVAPPRPAVILAHAAAAVRRLGHVLAPRPVTTLPAAFARPPLPLVVDAVAMRRPPARTGRAYVPRPVVLSIPITRPYGITVLAHATACQRRGRVAMPRPAGLAAGGGAPPPSIIVTGSFNTHPRGETSSSAVEAGFD